ncbi:MAG TPA: FtsX-like permease family protein, partial [Syntrophomonadaceae bacterium]|nr:FtsX-like permease family protein [Syntrophomonadaceae bacterium]
MATLFKKLLRNIGRGKGQFIAVVTVVTMGILIYVTMSSTYYNLRNSQTDFYEATNFADYYYMVVKAPEQVINDIANLNGVKRVTGRIYFDLSILKDDNKRATARIVSYPLPMEDELNKLLLNGGQMFASGARGSTVEILTDPGFVEANDINWGDRVTVIYEGRLLDFAVIGTANSPEFVYPIKDIADLLPDPTSFGVFMLPHYEAQQVFNYKGQINQVLVEFFPGANLDKINAEIKEILTPYGFLASYPRDDQLSHALLQMELDSIKNLTTSLPIIFLFIAAMIQFIILRRMIRNQKVQVGVLKALGFSNWHIILHYALYALLIGFCGALIGIVAGWFLAGFLTDFFLVYFNLPLSSLSKLNTKVILYSFLLSMGVGLLAGLTAARNISKILPAESMRPKMPEKTSRSIVERMPFIWQRLGIGFKISLRNISRNRGRFTLNVIGIMFAVALLLVSYFMNDAIDFMQNSYYKEQNYDYKITVNKPIKEGELNTIANIEGVIKVEAFLHLPVRLTYQGQNEEDLIVAYNPDMSLKRISDEKGQTLFIPPEGLIISQQLAEKLGVSTGDEIGIETLLPNSPPKY